MVCRCGGILTFKTSGQEYVQYFYSLYARTLELVDSYINRYTTLAEEQDLHGYKEEKYELKYSYLKAVDGLKRTYTYLSEGVVDDKEMRCNVHIEFVAKSVKEEEGLYLTGLITVGGFIPGIGSMFSVIAGTISILNMGGNIIAKFDSDETQEVDYSLIDGAQDGVFIVDGAKPLIENIYKNSGGQFQRRLLMH